MDENFAIQLFEGKWGTICTPVVMLAPDGKKRKTQASDLEGIFRFQKKK